MSAEVTKWAPVQEWREPGDRHARKPRGRVPWDIHVKAWEEYARQNGRMQTAERIAERQGFSYFEIQVYLAELKVFPRTGAGLPDVPGWEAA